MIKRLSIAILAAAVFAGTGSAAMLATSAPAFADQDNHHVRVIKPPHRANHGVNPYGANGYWSNGAWHNRLASTNPGKHHHYGWNKHHPRKPRPHGDRG